MVARLDPGLHYYDIEGNAHTWDRLRREEAEPVKQQCNKTRARVVS